MKRPKKNPDWAGKIGNVSQLGGIETSVLDNGPAHGSRIAWFNTGSPLRFKVAIDRCLDIVDTFYSQHSLAWISHTGLTVPQPHANSGLEWLYTFAGGLLTTCGLCHTGAPEIDEHGDRGLHGRISNFPATIESIIQPDPLAGKMDMSITALIKDSKVFGPCLELRRTISATLGEPTVLIQDVVTNRGNTPQPHMILYHCNFGWPLVDKGTKIIGRGNWHPLRPEIDSVRFNNKIDYKTCMPPLPEHSGMKEYCAAVEMASDSKGWCVAGLHNPKLNLAMQMRFKKKQLPWLTNWQHWGTDEYVTALEPGTHAPIGQGQARKDKTLIFLKPGQFRKYELEISVLTEPTPIKQFLKLG
jgi:hypothetical protein